MPDAALSAALAEAYASAPVAEIVHHTVEIRHASFATPIRVVRDHATLTATLESDAPEDAGAEVSFLGYGFDIRPPEVSAAGSPQMAIEIDNVSRDILANVELAMATSDLIEATYRAYLSSDLSAPQNDPPLTLTVSKISASLMRITAQAGFDDMSNKRFPAEEYTAEAFPGLLQQ